MPLLNEASFMSQAFWFGLLFLGFWVVMHFAIVPRIGCILERRRAHIHDLVSKIQRIQKETEALIASDKQDLEEARESIKRRMAEALDAIRISRDLRKKERDSLFQKKLKMAQVQLREELQIALESAAACTPELEELVLKRALLVSNREGFSTLQ